VRLVTMVTRSGQAGGVRSVSVTWSARCPFRVTHTRARVSADPELQA
ncbi:uncharacterized, partial [Tachysurus ichikawai]